MHRRGHSDPGDRKQIIKRIEQVLSDIEECCEELEEVVLFGSYARGEAEEYSTMDLLIISETDLPFIERIKMVIELVSENTIPVEPLVYTPDEIREKLREGDSFILSAMNEGVLVWRKGKDLDVSSQLEKKARESEFEDLWREVD